MHGDETEEPVQTETVGELDPPGANVEKTDKYYRDFIEILYPSP